jgi:hypothetical protein
MDRPLKVFAQWWRTRKLLAGVENGDICAVESGDGRYGIVKVLKIDASAVHVALYQNRYTVRPTRVDPATLTFGTMVDAGRTGVGHLPLSRETFSSWLPVRIQHESVTDEELEGYRLWEEFKGGTWG